MSRGNCREQMGSFSAPHTASMARRVSRRPPKGPKYRAPSSSAFTRQSEPGVGGPGVQPDEGVSLVVLEQDVVARLEALDHVVLEQERLALAGDDRVAQVGDPGDHDPHFRALVRFRREVGVDPPVQVFRLAHVDHLSVGAQKLVDAGRLGQQGDLLFELLDALGWFHGV
mgnify:CR=1 FL=1